MVVSPSFHEGFGERLKEDCECLNQEQTSARALVLVGAMLVEQRINGTLRALLPGIPAEELERIPLGQRTKLLEGLVLIPPAPLERARFISKVRNAFAHEVPVCRFEDLEKKVRARLSDVLPTGDEGEQRLYIGWLIIVNRTVTDLEILQQYAEKLSGYLRSEEFGRKVEEWRAEAKRDRSGTGEGDA
jgi:hypothetical protein